MLGGDKNLKDSIKDTKNMPAPYEAGSFHSGSVILSYTKTNKLITALYMVTDIIDKEEPIRHKLRTLGTGIISDIHSVNTHSNACSKIYEIMSFLDIAYAINIVSEMNCNILRKEFLELNQSIKDSTDKVEILNRQINIEDFFGRDSSKKPLFENRYESIGHSKGHANLSNGQQRTRIGVQKGSTLLKALSDKTSFMSDRKTNGNDPASYEAEGFRSGFNILKKQRRDDIINSIKKNGGSSTITDIKNKAISLPAQAGSLASCSEKTLQRELISMVKDGVLKKTGEKRWSRYFLIQSQ